MNDWTPVPYGLPVGTRAVFKSIGGRLYMDRSSIRPPTCAVCGTQNNVVCRSGIDVICGSCKDWAIGEIIQATGDGCQVDDLHNWPARVPFVNTLRTWQQWTRGAIVQDTCAHTAAFYH